MAIKFRLKIKRFFGFLNAIFRKIYKRKQRLHIATIHIDKRTLHLIIFVRKFIKMKPLNLIFLIYKCLIPLVGFGVMAVFYYANQITLVAAIGWIPMVMFINMYVSRYTEELLKKIRNHLEYCYNYHCSGITYSQKRF
ncbi:MAG: hypothetical protein CVU11_04360 [Bacteroidetes bacterium HGW-Bacteroidetes-6]|nr:MAG: hypothetical protein CVU11_04360 [Bacteroidetes bacterium HGW-Bacteroidetes-6]